MKSFIAPSLIVITTGFPLPSRGSNLAGGLAKITIEAKGKASEISLSFDFKLWYFSHFAFELVTALLMFGFLVPKYLESYSWYVIPMIGLSAFGLLFIPWNSRECVKNTEKEVVAQSKASLRKAEITQNTRTSV